jgi:Flp pilus assembly protein TadD
MEPDFDVAIAIGRGAVPGRADRDEALAGTDVLPERAFANFRRAAHGEPLDPDYVYILGTALADRGRHAEAATAFKDAIALDRRQAPYFVALGVSRWHLGSYDEAVAAFEEALALAPADAAALNGLGVALLGQGRPADGSAVLERAAAASPDAWEPAVNGAIARWQAGDPEGALAVLRKAAGAWPDVAAVVRPLGRALLARGERVEALALFERVERLAPDDAAARLDRGDALHGLGRAEEADAAYAEAQRLDPRALVGRPDSLDARRAIALQRLRAELATPPSPAARLVRAFWSAVGAGLHALRRAPARGVGAAFSLRGLVWTVPLSIAVWVGVAFVPAYARHYLLEDDLRTIARTPLDDDGLVRERLRDAVQDRGLAGHIPDDCFSVETEPRFRTITCAYAVPVALVPGYPRELRFQLRVKEIVLILPDSRHY